MKNKQLVVIIGRKNAGKSTLFNRLIEEERSITSSIPGTTRDSNHAVCVWRGRSFPLIDTGGLDSVNPSTSLRVDTERSVKDDAAEKEVDKKNQTILKQTKIILYVVDGKLGAKDADRQALNQLKKNFSAKLILVVNKLDSKKQIDLMFSEFHRLGTSEIIPVSAASGMGTGDLLDRIVNYLPAQNLPPAKKPAITLAVVGRPNVGKSSLVNAILSSDRLIISHTPGTTRDAQYIPFKYQKKQWMIIDTAGVRKKSRVGKQPQEIPREIEIASVRKSLKAIKECDLALLVLDLAEQVGNQDKKLARTIVNERKGIILVANKWDLIKNKDEKTIEFYRQYLLNNLPFLKWAPLIFVSALRGIRVKKILELAEQVRKSQSRIISQGELDAFTTALIAHRPLPKRGGEKSLKTLLLEQDQRQPLRFILKIKPGQFLPEYYKSYLVNMLRVHFDLFGNPLELIIKKTKNG